MAPKKKPQQQQKAKSKSKSKPGSSDPKPAPKLQISAENERRLRRLLINTDLPSPPQPPPETAKNDAAPSSSGYFAGGVTDGGETKAQKAKQLRNLYDKLSLEGFTSDQIEQALYTLPGLATFETALDWLCFNIPGNELPLKFSTDGTSTSFEGTDVSVKVLRSAREDWEPGERNIEVIKEENENFEIKNKVKNKNEDISLDDGKSKSSQAAWILEYMQREEEEEERNVIAASNNEENKPRDADVIIEEYKVARLGAIEAKQKKDKNGQGHFGKIIAKLRQELSSLGISEEVLSFDTGELKINTSTEIEPSSKVTTGDLQYLGELESIKASAVEPKEEEEEEIELGDMLFEEESFVDSADVLKKENLEKLKNDGYAHMLGNIDDIWKQGEDGKLPKPVLHKLCQRLGWDAPRYSKVFDKDSKFVYSVNVLRLTTGRGKSRKAGGLTTFQLPDDDQVSTSVEDAQNRVATFALYQLFAGLPLCSILSEPFSSLVSKWQNEELSNKTLETQEKRRDEFVNMLVNKHESNKVRFISGKIIEGNYLGDSISSPEKIKVVSSENTGLTARQKAESIYLKKELANKINLPKYRKMLETRSALPIAKLKKQFINLLEETNVIVVCGETGCGKTTQVPQFILDDMIESGLGGCCSIICTQPRRIAAISVAERVSDERCESSPGSDDSLVGYQVRLDSARNENTKLLFCTTGILLRKLSTNKNFEGITHVVVDEVHERSLLGDFLLIVLKNLIEKQSTQGGRKLKVILMSATVDASLFSRYFGGCPVITAQGRTHPVSTNFLEDIYELINYSLSSDSLSAGSSMSFNKQKGQRGSESVNNRRGMKNLVLSSWGDESILSDEYTNPNYIHGSYDSYSDKTRQNLKRVNEDIIDFDLLEDLVCYIDEHYPPGAILIFLPGVAEIDLLVDKLTASYRFGGTAADWVIPLHSLLSSSDQKKAFLSPPQNIRKVIIATDIAETSITIDDVVYVVETGKHKENRYNPQKKMSSIVEDWISRANAKQRRGRAGRVKPGICFCLYTRYRFEIIMRPFQVPEMLRMPLTELCLHIKSLSLGDIKSFLLKAIEPPREESISSAINLLYKVGAFEGDEILSPLGYHLSKLPVDVLIGKMMLYGAIFGCLSPILSLAAFLSHKSPFIYPKDEKQNVEKAKLMLLNEAAFNGDNKQSDHILMILAYNKWAKILHESGPKSAQLFCKSFFLNSSVLHMIRDMRTQFGTLLADIGLVNMPKDILYNDKKRKSNLDVWFSNPTLPFNINAQHSSLIKSVICAGLYPNIATTIEGIEKGILTGKKLSDLKNNFLFDGRREVHIHPSSINNTLKSFQYPFIVFLEKVETTKVYLRDTTIVSPYSLLLFGGPMLIQHQLGYVVIDGWLKLTAPAQTAVLFKELRTTLDAVLKQLIRKPEMGTLIDNEVVKSIVHLLLEEEKEKQSGL